MVFDFIVWKRQEMIIPPKKGAGVMKYFNKLIVFLVLVLLSYGVDTFAYTYKISNQTGRDVKIQLRYAFGRLNEKVIFIRSRGIHTLVFRGWSSGLCLTKIMVSTKKSGKWEKLKKAEIRIKKPKTIESAADLLYRIISGSAGICESKRIVLRIDPVFGDLIASVYDY